MTTLLVQLTADDLRALVRDAVRVELAAHRLPPRAAEVEAAPVTEDHRRKAAKILARPRRIRRAT